MDKISLQEYLETLLDEKDKRYEERFIAQEKAIDKAEASQRDYNAKSNEFRGQLDDQAKTFVPRNELDNRFASLDEKIQDLRESRSQIAGKSLGANALWGYLLGVVGLISIIVTLYLNTR